MHANLGATADDWLPPGHVPRCPRRHADCRRSRPPQARQPQDWPAAFRCGLRQCRRILGITARQQVPGSRGRHRCLALAAGVAGFMHRAALPSATGSMRPSADHRWLETLNQEARACGASAASGACRPSTTPAGFSLHFVSTDAQLLLEQLRAVGQLADRVDVPRHGPRATGSLVLASTAPHSRTTYAAS